MFAATDIWQATIDPRQAPMIVVVMGVSGSGKTTMAKALADAFGWPFVEADDLHPPANVEKMSRGEPFDDADRAPWLDAVAARMRTLGGRRRRLLRAAPSYRDALARATRRALRVARRAAPSSSRSG